MVARPGGEVVARADQSGVALPGGRLAVGGRARALVRFVARAGQCVEIGSGDTFGGCFGRAQALFGGRDVLGRGFDASFERVDLGVGQVGGAGVFGAGELETREFCIEFGGRAGDCGRRIRGAPGCLVAARTRFLPAMLLIADATEAREALVPAVFEEIPGLLAGRVAEDGARAWVCKRGVCLLPADDVGKLFTQLATLTARADTR